MTMTSTTTTAATTRTPATPATTRTPVTPAPPAHAPVPVAGTALDLLDRSRASLLAACCSSSADERYVDAHLGALRAAAALLAARRVPGPRSRPRSVWALLPTVAAELAEWATFFEASARRRTAIERGTAPVACREADDLLRQAEVFHELVQAALGLPMAEPLPDFVTPTSPGASR